MEDLGTCCFLTKSFYVARLRHLIPVACARFCHGLRLVESICGWLALGCFNGILYSLIMHEHDLLKESKRVESK